MLGGILGEHWISLLHPAGAPGLWVAGVTVLQLFPLGPLLFHLGPECLWARDCDALGFPSQQHIEDICFLVLELAVPPWPARLDRWVVSCGPFCCLPFAAPAKEDLPSIFHVVAGFCPVTSTFHAEISGRRFGPAAPSVLLRRALC